MSAETLRRAAAEMRQDDQGPVILAVADWLDAEIPNAEFRERQQREAEATRVRREPFPVYYDPTTVKALTVANAYLSGDQR